MPLEKPLEDYTPTPIASKPSLDIPQGPRILPDVDLGMLQDTSPKKQEMPPELYKEMLTKRKNQLQVEMKELSNSQLLQYFMDLVNTAPELDIEANAEDMINIINDWSKDFYQRTGAVPQESDMREYFLDIIAQRFVKSAGFAEAL